MERLTERRNGDAWLVVNSQESAREVINRLADYEDTGLTPVEVAQLANPWEDVEYRPSEWPADDGDDVPIIVQFDNGEVGQATYHGEGVYTALRMYADRIGCGVTLCKENVTDDIIRWMPMPQPQTAATNE